MAVKAIPDGYLEVTPFITVDGAEELIAFLKRTFGAEVRFHMPTADGKVGHAEVTIGRSVIMIADPDERDLRATATLHLYVEDVDQTFQVALEAGATSESEPETHFYGDRSGSVLDRWGNRWYIASHVEDVSPEEMANRMAAMAPA